MAKIASPFEASCSFLLLADVGEGDEDVAVRRSDCRTQVESSQRLTLALASTASGRNPTGRRLVESSTSEASIVAACALCTSTRATMAGPTRMRLGRLNNCLPSTRSATWEVVGRRALAEMSEGDDEEDALPTTTTGDAGLETRATDGVPYHSTCAATVISEAQAQTAAVAFAAVLSVVGICVTEAGTAAPGGEVTGAHITDTVKPGGVARWLVERSSTSRRRHGSMRSENSMSKPTIEFGDADAARPETTASYV